MIEKAVAFLKSRKKEQLLLYGLLTALVVVVFLPTGKKTEKKEAEKADDTEETTVSVTSETKELEQRLEEALSRIHGVGKVHVTVMMESTNRKIVEKDSPDRKNTEETRNGENSSTMQSESRDESTVYEKDGDGTEIPYVISEEYPKVRGVLVIAEGGDQPVVVQEIQEAVMALFQVGANKIKVVKME